MIVRTLGFSLVLAAASGCVFGPTHWTSDEGSLTPALQGMETIRVTTHNGDIDYLGTDGFDGPLRVAYERRGGGTSEEAAAESLAAIRVFAEPKGSTLHVGWRFEPPRRRGQHGAVRFRIEGPAGLEVVADSHNGDIRIVSEPGSTVSGSINSHNGDIRLTSSPDSPGTVRFHSHNGRASAPGEFTLTREGSRAEIHSARGGDELRIDTHNGDLSVRARKDRR